MTGQQPGQQALALKLQLEEFINIQRSGVADHIRGEGFTETMAADHGLRGQARRRAIKVAALGIGVNGFERMGDGLDLAHSPGGVFQPNRRLKLRQQLGAFGVIVGQLVELAIAAFQQERRDDGSNRRRPP